MRNRGAIPIGLSLKFDRQAAGVKAVEVARKMGVSSSRMTRIEDAHMLEPEVVDRYRKAIEDVLTDRRNERIRVLKAELEGIG